MVKGQISMEFIILLGMLIVILLAFLLVLNDLTQDKYKEKAEVKMRDMGISIQNELILASQVEPGYRRIITIPEDLDGIPFTISNDDRWLYLVYKSIELPFRIPNITNSLSNPGTFEISNLNGQVSVNPI